MVFFFFFVVFFATVVVVDLGAVVTFGATVLFDEVGLANASVVVVVFAAAVVVGPAFTLFLLFITELGAVVATNAVVVGPMLTTFLLIVGVLAIVVGGVGNVVFTGEVDSVGMRRPVAYEVVGPMLTTFLLIEGKPAVVVGPAFTAPLLMATFFVFSSALPLSEPPQALTTTSETAVKERATTRGEMRIPHL